MEKQIVFDPPCNEIMPTISIKELSPELDGFIKFTNQLSAFFFAEALACWNHQLYFGCIALADESVAKAISIELEGGRGIKRRKEILPQKWTHQGRIEILINEYPCLEPFRDKILKLHNHYRNIWVHGITKKVHYKEPVKGSLLKECLIDPGQHETSLGIFDTELLTGPNKEIYDKGLKEYHIITSAGKTAEECLLLATDILKNAIPLLY